MTPITGRAAIDGQSRMPAPHTYWSGRIMANPKSVTELAMNHKREAYVERACKDPPVLAPMWEREAAKLLTLPEPPDVGAGGEVVHEHPAPDARAENALQEGKWKRANLRDTLAQGATRIAEEASIRRTDLLMQPSFDAVALAVDAAESIQAANSLEKMLAHQLAVAHEASMRLMDRALAYEAGGRSMREGDSVEACRLANTVARLMSVFQDGLLTLQRLRTGGNQTVTVQHVNVQPGAQAVIGNVQTGGAKRRGNNAKDG
jgi:hypothetical protein